LKPGVAVQARAMNRFFERRIFSTNVKADNLTTTKAPCGVGLDFL
jgi:hypothetical protein